MNFEDLDPAQAKDVLADFPDLKVLDVRTFGEFVQHRLEKAELRPIQELGDSWQGLDPDADWLVVCEHGVRSVAACEFLAERGFDSLRNLRGGMAHWIHQGFDVVQGPPS